MRPNTQPRTPRNRGIFSSKTWMREGSLCNSRQNGGESGIRTHGRLPYTRFPSVRLRPLGHLSAEADRARRLDGRRSARPVGYRDSAARDTRARSASGASTRPARARRLARTIRSAWRPRRESVAISSPSGLSRASRRRACPRSRGALDPSPRPGYAPSPPRPLSLPRPGTRSPPDD